MAKVKIGEKVQEAKLLIFDKDGTLINFEVWIPVMKKRAEIILELLNRKTGFESLVKVLGVDLEKECIIPDGNVFTSRQRTARDTVDFLVKKWKVPERLAEKVVLEAFSRADNELDFTQLWKPVIKNIIEYFSHLKVNNIKIALATSDTFERAKACLSSLNIFEFFDEIVGSDLVKQDKPSPDMIIYLIKKLGISNKEEVFMIGDSLSDVKMAKAAKVNSVGVLSGRCSREELEPYADFIIKDISQIIPVE